MKKFYFVFSIILCFQFIQAQQINFEQYTASKNGLSQSVIICSFQDSFGFLWFGTQNGLNRFDGYTFRTFLHSVDDTNSISNNWIFSIIEDKNRNLWIGTKDGLNFFNRKTEKFQKIGLDNSKNTVVYGLFNSKENKILINTINHLYILNADNFQIEEVKVDLQFDNSVRDFAFPVIQDSDGQIWVATYNGLMTYDPVKRTKKYFTQNSINNISNNFVYSFLQDPYGNLWIGTANGLNKYSNRQKSITQIIYPSNISNSTDNTVYSLASINNQELYLGTNSGVLKIYLDKKNTSINEIYNSQNSNLSNNIVYSLIIDKSQNLWAGTLKELSKADLKPKKFRLYQKNDSYNSVDLLDNIIASIYKQNDSIIWIGNWGSGLNILNRKTNELKYYSTTSTGKYRINNNFIHCIYSDNLDIFVGTRDGLLVYNSKNETFERPSFYFHNKEINDLEGYRIFRIIQDNKKNYWIATERGVYCFNSDFIQIDLLNTESTPFSITNNLIYNVIEDNEGCIWIATSVGLNCYNPKEKQIQHFLKEENNKNSLCDNFVVSLCVDSKGNIWIGTQTGANYYDKKTKNFTYFSKQNGLPDNLVYEIFEDNQKNIWFATSNGLAKYNANNQHFTKYSIFDGLQGYEFNLNAKYISKDGEVFIGGMNGVNSFYPDAMYENRSVPSTIISKFEIYNKSGKRLIPIEYNQKITLSYLDYEFTIDFSTTDYTNPEQNKFAYKMIGTSEDWIDIGNRHSVTFSKLSPGQYTFWVKGTNNDGLWSENPAVLTIYIKPPLWKTKFAYFLYILLGIFIVFQIIRLKLKSITKEKEILEMKVEERTKIIQEQKTKIEKAHLEIKSSINYAAKIQNALLPTENIIKTTFKEYLLFFLPRDIVSGDFCYVKQINQYKVFLVADCTGHGVPGAFLSVLAISLINDIANRKDIEFASEILENLRVRIKQILKQDNIEVSTKDGLDIAICILNSENQQVNYSGANNSILILKDKNKFNIDSLNHIEGCYKIFEDNNICKEKCLVELLPTKNPIGIYFNEVKFVDLFVKLEQGDIYYLYSDGFADQFSSGQSQKFTKNRFKRLILQNASLTMEEQKDRFEKEFFDWKGNYFQIDDVLVLGIKP